MKFVLGGELRCDLQKLIDTRALVQASGEIDCDAQVQARFWAKVRKDGRNGRRDRGCWLWIASDNGNGYGIFRGGVDRDARGSRRWVLAHRYAYELLIGPVPLGLELDHLCRVRRCVNPAHLRPLSHRQNTLAGESPPARQARRDGCLRGHPFDKVERGGSRRRCSICDREKELRRYVARHGRVPRPNARTRRRLEAAQ